MSKKTNYTLFRIALDIITMTGAIVTGAALLMYFDYRETKATTAYSDGVSCSLNGVSKTYCESLCIVMYDDDQPILNACSNGVEDGRSQLRGRVPS